MHCAYCTMCQYIVEPCCCLFFSLLLVFLNCVELSEYLKDCLATMCQCCFQYLILVTINADESTALNALQTLADLSLMLPDSTMESGKCLMHLVHGFPPFIISLNYLPVWSNSNFYKLLSYILIIECFSSPPILKC